MARQSSRAVTLLLAQQLLLFWRPAVITARFQDLTEPMVDSFEPSMCVGRYIIGAQKCGTTYLYNTIHSQLEVNQYEKEQHFWDVFPGMTGDGWNATRAQERVRAQ
eukprot:scaffold668843_cov47-Prasinocladus_malaysianus.AAC.1